VSGNMYSASVILRYNGSSWSAMTNGTTLGLAGVWGSSASDVFAVGGDVSPAACVILHYDGSTWSAMTNGVPRLPVLAGVWGTSATDVFAVGSGGTILHYGP